MLLSLSIHPLVTPASSLFPPSLHIHSLSFSLPLILRFIISSLSLSLPFSLTPSLSLGIRHSKIFLWHVVKVITPSLSLPQSISLIFLNLPAQSEVRISFSLSLINLLHLPVLYFSLPPSFSSSLSLSSPLLLCSGSSSPAAFLILLLAQFVSPLLPTSPQSPVSFCFMSSTKPQRSFQLSVSPSPFSFHFHLSDFFYFFLLSLQKGSRDFCIQSNLLTLSCVLTCSPSFMGASSEGTQMFNTLCPARRNRFVVKIQFRKIPFDPAENFKFYAIDKYAIMTHLIASHFLKAAFHF